ncbi:MAG: biosynthetic arginine decarboxylase [Planctomycetota bacterium]|jgi:arginine decarboxylase
MTFSITDAERLYGIDAWGQGYFRVNGRGHLCVHPGRGDDGIDLYRLISRLRRRKLRFPVLLRFPQILAQRVDDIFGAFGSAIAEFHYNGDYRGVYPIKVNQQRDVLEELMRAGRKRGLGFEAGSKAELAVALSYRLDPDAVVICNGYKDKHYVRLALRGLALGKKVFLIVEKPQEVPLIMDVARETGIPPLLGMRIRLRARGSGKWEKSGGAASKFGLTTQELLDAVEELKRYDALESFQLLHFHVGSQITEIKRIKNAVKEGARIYAKLRAEGAPLTYLDVGGGLGVDYDGSKTSYEASMNYSVTEYANDVVYSVQEICTAENVPVPTLISESGRALVAYHSMVLLEVSGQNVEMNGDELIVPADAHEGVQELREIHRGMTRKNHREYLHDADEVRDTLLGHFDLGYLSLRDRALTERLVGLIGQKALAYAREERYVPEEFEYLEKRLITKYIANFSVFQSIPDSWALDQLFPTVPIHRLNEKPTVRATLCDVTCDSDGEVDRFPDLRDVKDSLELHPLRPGKPYYLAILLTGAYQDVLGDYHNLFGRVDEALVNLGKSGARISRVVPGDDADDVLRLFRHDPEKMVQDIQALARTEVRERRITRAEANEVLAEYREALEGYTYLDFYE